MTSRSPLLLVFALLVLAGCTVPERLLFSTPKSMPLEAPPDRLVREVLFPSDGLQLNGWYLPGARQSPVVLYFHGTGTNLAGVADDLYHLWRQLGVAVFAFDYRGFGASEGEPSVQGVYADARAALAWLRTQGWLPEQTIYFGHSLGAAVALQLALEEPPAGLVLESAFTSLGDLVGWHHPSTWWLWGWLFPDHYDNLTKIADLQVPLLLVHGDADAKVPPTMARRLFARAPGPKCLFLVAGGRHQRLWHRAGTAYWEGWQRFLRHLDGVGRIAGAPAVARAGTRLSSDPLPSGPGTATVHLE